MQDSKHAIRGPLVPRTRFLVFLTSGWKRKLSVSLAFSPNKHTSPFVRCSNALAPPFVEVSHSRPLLLQICAAKTYMCGRCLRRVL
eukprot:321864-Rhodomonas_salina.2